MKRRLIEYLACPDCERDLALAKVYREADEVLEGELRCAGCQRLFPVVRGVPRLVPAAVDHETTEVAASFGWEWNRFDEIRPHYHQQFLDWIQPLRPDDFVDKLVLDAGCGKGRHTALAAGYGAREVFAVDLGAGVEAAYRNTAHLRAVHVIQGDVTRLPLKPRIQLAYSVGVLHHMRDPHAGFRAIVGRLAAGGLVTVWVYGREGNEWIVRALDPVRTRVTARLPRWLLYELSRPLGYAVAALAKGVYRPLAQARGAGRGLYARLFYREYLTYIAPFPRREVHSIVFGQLVTPVAHYVRRREVADWFDDPRLEDVRIARHNGNSWRARARRAPDG